MSENECPLMAQHVVRFDLSCIMTLWVRTHQHLGQQALGSARQALEHTQHTMQLKPREMFPSCGLSHPPPCVRALGHAKMPMVMVGQALPLSMWPNTSLSLLINASSVNPSMMHLLVVCYICLQLP